jgi:hypothetical protein
MVLMQRPTPNNTILSVFDSLKLDFPRCHTSWYYSRIRRLNCGVRIGSDYHGFKTYCVKNNVNKHRSTSSFPYPGDVERHSHPLLGLSVPAGDPYDVEMNNHWQSLWACARSPISSWAMVLIPLIPFVTTHLQQHNIVCFWLPRAKFLKRSLILVLFSHKHT